jgi:putative molybdopterin biosynthesis protein
MKSRRVQLQYRFGGEPGAGAQQGEEVDNPLFDLLSALAAAGSIQQAAQTLGLSYRHLWGQLKQWEQTLGEPLVSWVRGQPARLTPFAERLLWAERQARVRMAPHIAALRHELERVLDEALDGTRQVLRIDASHDLALPELQALGAAQRLHIELRFAGSLDALRSLAEGRCLVAGFHVPVDLPPREPTYVRALKPLLEPGLHKLMGCMRRRQGLALARGNPHGIESLGDVIEGGFRFVSREPGSGTGLLTEYLAARAGCKVEALRVSAIENSHLAVATAVAGGLADAGIALEAAAVSQGLDFVPLVLEDYVLVCLADALETPGLRALRQLLASPAWGRTLQRLAGYGTSASAGQVLSLTRALPWWHFRSPPAREAADQGNSSRNATR